MRYRVEHAEVKKKPNSGESDERNLRIHVLPAPGRLRLDKITRADVARFHAAMKHKPGAADRCLSLLSKMLGLAEAWGLQPDGSNPAGLDDVDGDPQAGAQAQQRAGVVRYIGLEKDQSHGVDFLPGIRRFRALRSG